MKKNGFCGVWIVSPNKTFPHIMNTMYENYTFKIKKVIQIFEDQICQIIIVIKITYHYIFPNIGIIMQYKVSGRANWENI